MMIRPVMLCGCLLPALLAAAPAPRLLTWEGRTMGTFYIVKLAGVEQDAKLAAELRAVVEQRLDELNREMSHYLPESELSHFNSSAATTPCKVSAPFAHVVRHSLAVCRESGGAFDPTLGALINLWGFGPGGSMARVPADDEIAAAQRSSGAQHLRVTDADELQKDVPGLQINLGGVAKGFGADEVARLLRERCFTNVFVSVCGEIVACGVNPEGHPWQVGVERPLYDIPHGAALSAIVPLSGRALSTSGDTHNFFRDKQGKVFAHILDPATGRPVNNNTIASVTVIATNGLTADSLTKPLYIMGLERGLRWIEARPDTAALFIIREDAGRLRLVASSRFPAFQTLESQP
ncbi:MAG: FAD:protein FMN transferase [Kiritimatiellaeota bacterium]|nr:FAD:protein FMN transferase [Kiritimatiellota bacterium]